MDNEKSNPLYRRGVPVSLTRLKRVDEIASAMVDSTISGDIAGMVGSSGVDGVQLGAASSPAMKGLWVRIIGQNPNFKSMYSFQPVFPQGTDAVPNDITYQPDTSVFNYPAGTFNAKEISGNKTVPANPANGAIVWLVPSGVQDFWEFSFAGSGGTPLAIGSTAFIALTNLTTQVINLQGGGTQTVYAAQVWVLLAGVWTADISCWYLGANGEVPPLILRKLARVVAFDTSLVPVFAEDLPVNVMQVTSSTSQVINLQGGGTLTVYPGQTQELVSGVWTNKTPGWFYPINNGNPIANFRYNCTAVAIDTNSVVVYASDPFTPNNVTLVYNNDTFNYTTDVFNYFGINNFYIQNNSWIIFNFPTTNAFDVSGIVINIPLTICGYQFWCCTLWSPVLSDNVPLPAVGSPDSGATVYDITGGGTLNGILPQGMGPQLNTGAVTAATNASPIVLTVPGWTTQPAVGAVVVVKNINGNTAANGVFTVQAVTATTLTLTGSTGNGAFTASPNSAIQTPGPSIIAVRSISGQVTLTHGAGTSKAFAQILIPPAYQTADVGLSQLILSTGDAAILWWDQCSAQAWVVLATTVPAIVTKNVDLTQRVSPTYQITANNTMGTVAFGRIKFTNTSTLGKVNQLDWQGIRAYSAGVGLVGPEPDIEIDGDVCPTGSSQTIGVKLRDDQANQRVVVSLYTIGDTAVITIPIATGGTVNSDCSITLTYSPLRLTFNCGLFEGSSGYGQTPTAPLVSGQNTATQAAVDPSLTQPPPDLFGGSGHTF